jgi:hypothetical protein
MSIAAALILALVGLAHSALGEVAVLRPLIASPDWRIGVPRRYANRLLRGAWHLTSVAWWALAGILLGWSVHVVVGVVCLVSGAVIFAFVPGHLAWPFFTVAGLLALSAGGALPAWTLWGAAALAVLAAVVAAAFHAAWAAGSTRGVADVLPQRSGTHERLWSPGAGPTLAVVAALLGYAVVVVALVLGAAGAWWRWLGIAALVVLLARVVGDARYVGVLKRVRDTRFARADDRYWTPAVGLLAAGVAAALALG